MPSTARRSSQTFVPLGRVLSSGSLVRRPVQMSLLMFISGLLRLIGGARCAARKRRRPASGTEGLQGRGEPPLRGLQRQAGGVENGARHIGTTNRRERSPEQLERPHRRDQDPYA